MNEAETVSALGEVCETILIAAKQVLEQTPPELSADIVNKGIFLTGGGALLKNLDKFLEQGLKVPVFVADTPLDCVAEGLRCHVRKHYILTVRDSVRAIFFWRK